MTANDSMHLVLLFSVDCLEHESKIHLFLKDKALLLVQLHSLRITMLFDFERDSLWRCRARGFSQGELLHSGEQGSSNSFSTVIFVHPQILHVDAIWQFKGASADAGFHLGVNGNPVYREMFRRPATACGASILAARLLHEPGIVYNPAGGTHHGQPDRASGFCMFNDPVLAILEMLDGGLERVFYLDVVIE